MNDLSADPRRRRFVFPSDMAELDHVVREAEAFVENITTNDELKYRFVLLTTEAVTNAVEHGNRFDPTKMVKLDLIAADEHLEVWVEDEGEGFNPNTVDDPLLEENLLREGGRGIFLIESLADEYRYEEGGRRLRIVFRHPA